MEPIMRILYTLYLCKLISREVKEDVERFEQERILKGAEERKTTKKCRRDMLLYRNNLKALEDKNGNTTESRAGMGAICEEFYTQLMSSRSKVPPPHLPRRNERLLEVLISEVRNAIVALDSGKAPGKDGITVEMLRAKAFPLWRDLARMFSRYLELRQISKA
ncbi:hypothetical protein Y032_0883g2849 [Ancylostoma ceylanicum]|uniref:Reverse transcriptase domain-containing protein n=1 Tax=Ancylostoma ceylanicum TaxID=53326 RepID=A0A016WBC6_9BILA|nr:hypothetical protein Y032_0883g2849 [Ancylostoma ceylanicum]